MPAHKARAAATDRTTVRVAHLRLRLFCVTGLLGGFTAFSAFSLETTTLLADPRYPAAVTYLLLSVAGCITLSIAGLKLGR